jgi:small subunit ribosomal protein S16
VAVKIKLKRMGKIHAPYYRVVVADARSKRDGRAIEEIGKYHPKLEPSLIEIDSERAQYWLSVGAQPTDPVRSLLKITGDWQRFHGEEGAEGTLKTGAPGPDKKEAFAAALKETHGEAEGAATTQKGRVRKADKAGAADAEAGAKKAAAKSARSAKPDGADKARGADTAEAGESGQAGGAARKRGAAAKADANAGAGAAADEAGANAGAGAAADEAGANAGAGAAADEAGSGA